MTRAALCAPVLAPLFAIAWLTPAARADPDPISVAAYLQTLNQAHVPYDDPGKMVELGNSVCQQSRGGAAFDDVGESVIGRGFTPTQAGLIMGAAVATFCPDMQPSMGRWSNS
ncbi:DUF732 domain-containing protein [Mycobacterium saskatchewanense]|uniref:RNA helicase n=1 Tax=Mycobacterium saskatchewanense TaxID=220927 RepID=A0AAJ3NL79_9MYCO|nr:DUF732 domain-containing protein [Mycobacterium saskatchewanense]ORW64597.1 RNA helicase [Mycobacterium saskatchewanense]